MDDGRCAQILESGETCGGYAVKGSIYCFSHDPKSREKRLRARAAGGRAAGKAKRRESVVREVVAAAQVLPMFEVDSDLELGTMTDLRTFAVEQVKRLRLDFETGGYKRGEEIRHWMNFLLNLSKVEMALAGGRGEDGNGRTGAAPAPEPNTLAWLERIARGSAGGIAGS